MFFFFFFFFGGGGGEGGGLISNDTKFKKSFLQLRDFFSWEKLSCICCGWSIRQCFFINTGRGIANFCQNWWQKNVIPILIEYNPSLPKMWLIVNKYWDLLQLAQKASVNSVHGYKPILAFRRPWNLHDFLVRSSFVDRTNHLSQTCDQRRCFRCIIKTDVFTSSSPQATFKMRYRTSCMSQSVIYLIECKRCNMQYIG